jgi:O-acetyl-ADP-ribose deacetylase (regulator of RNase III)
MAVPIQIDVWQGEVAELEVDAIIVPATESLFMTSPLARAVKRRAGETVEMEAIRQGPVDAGSAVVTGGGRLATPYLIHAVAVGHELHGDTARLRAALDAAFSMAARLSLTRVAMTPIGLERGAFTPDEAAAELIAVIEDRARRGEPLPASLVIAVANAAESVAFGSASEALRAATRCATSAAERSPPSCAAGVSTSRPCCCCTPTDRCGRCWPSLPSSCRRSRGRSPAASCASLPPRSTVTTRTTD